MCNSEGIADESDTIKAPGWVLSLNPDVINLSLGIFRDCDGTCPICRAVNAIPDVITVVAFGNEGPSENSINCTGNAKKALTVGAIHKDKIMDMRSRGSKNKLKPDVVAPGKIEVGRFSVSGTLISTPIVSGYLALLLSVRNDKIKAIDSLKETAEDLGFELWERGVGKIRVVRALKIIKNG